MYVEAEDRGGTGGCQKVTQMYVEAEDGGGTREC